MHVEVHILAWGAVLLLIHVFVAGHFRTRQYGKSWNIGARDEQMPPLEAVPARLLRAQHNFLETFPVAIVALLGVVVAERTGTSTAIGGWIWLVARAVYLPIYGMGIRGLRTVVFLISVIGLLMVIWPLLVP